MRPPGARQPPSTALYLEQAAQCRAAAARAGDARLHAMLQEEYGLWLMLATQSDAIDAVVRRISLTVES